MDREMASAADGPTNDRYVPRRIDLSHSARRLVKLLLLAAVIHFFVIPQIGGARRSLQVVAGVNPALIAAAVGLEALSFLAYARFTGVRLEPEERPSDGILFGTVMASTAVNHVVPGGAATTLAVNYRLLGRAGVPGDRLGFVLATQAVASAVVLNMILWLALVVSIPVSGFHPIYATVAAIGAAVMAALAAALVAARRGRVGFADKVGTYVGRIPKIDGARVGAALLEVVRQLDVLAADRRRMFKVAVLAAANWLLDAAALFVALSAFGPAPGIVGLIVAYGLANVLAAIPISPGGLGVIEAILIPTLIGFGTPASEVSIGVVAYRLVNYWLPIPIGALCYLAVERTTAGNGRTAGGRTPPPAP